MPSEDPATSPSTAANPPRDRRLPAEGGPGHAEAVELEPRHTLEEPTPQLPAQPRAGILGLILVALGFVILGVLPGGPQHALETVGPIATFALPVLGVSALWWEGWPAQKLHQPLAGLANLALITIGGIVLTVIAQAVIGKVDLNGVFAVPAKASTTFPTWPWSMPLGVLAFVAFLQITFVNERWPFARLDGRLAGPAVLLAAWAIALVVYALIVNWDIVPAVARHAIGLRNPGGPEGGLTLLGWLACVTAYQVLFYIGLGGWPTIHLQNPVARLAAANALTIGGGWLTWLLLFHGFGWATPTIAALAAAVAAAAVISAILFDNWPAPRLRPTGTQIPLLLAQTALITAALYFGLRALGDAIQTWNRDPVDLWVTVSCLNFIAATAILHVAVFHRWPVITSRSA
jgi:hypothetical protein